jgi:hypothetical protein
MRPGLQLTNDARVVRGVARHRERQGGRAGAHGHDGHDLYCMLHHINRKDQKRGGSIEPPAN